MGGIRFKLKSLGKEKMSGGAASTGNAPDTKKERPRASPTSSSHSTPSPSSSPPAYSAVVPDNSVSSTAAPALGAIAPATNAAATAGQPISRYGRDQIIRCHVLDYKSTPGQQSQLISDPEDCLI